MPEGPELHLASLYVNKMCSGLIFTGAVRKSEVSKSPDVSFTCEAYRITATSRGKEVKLTLTPVKRDELKGSPKVGQVDQPVDVVFRFGMSGYFRLTSEEELPKHSHLRFYSNEKPCRVLSFVDTRRFGSWQSGGAWQPSRGPCILTEYKSFRENVLSHLSDHAFDRPICEVLLNQKYFNGIGNYLRAEILFRLNIPPFVSARTVLEGLESEDFCENKNPVKSEATDTKDTTSGRNNTHVRVKEEKADLLRLCHTVPLEVVGLGGTFYDPEKADYSDFKAWLQCYYVDGMKSLRDHNGRTMWFKHLRVKTITRSEQPPEPRSYRGRSGGGCKNISAAGEDSEASIILKWKKLDTTSLQDCLTKPSDVMEKQMTKNPGDPGPMAPKDSKSPKVKRKIKKEEHDYPAKKKVNSRRSANTTKESVIKQEPAIKSAGLGKNPRVKKAASKRTNESRSITRRRKTSSAERTEAGPLRRSTRAANRSSK